MMRADIDHLPETHRHELFCAVDLLFEEFAESLRGKQAAHRKAGRILKLILFGAFAQADWRERDASGDLAGFDILVIVNHAELADMERYWGHAIDRRHRAWSAGLILRPVRLAVHSLAEVNRKLVDGVPFFTAIARDGIALYQSSSEPLATPHQLSPVEWQARAREEYARWFPKAADFMAGATFYRERDNPAMAALLLHQACEHLYQCLLWTFTLHGRRSHALGELRALAEQQDARLVDVWPRATRFERRCFARLRRAYGEARYSAHYRIDAAEVAWAAERVALLREWVERVCRERCGRSAAER
jgi:HEPN domain-containing protein